MTTVLEQEAQKEHELEAHFEDEEEFKVIREYAIRNSPDQVLSLKYDPSDKYIAYGCEDGEVRLLDLETKELFHLVGNAKIIKTLQKPITSLCWKPGEMENPESRQMIACSSAGEIFCWCPASGELMNRFKESNQIYCCDYSPLRPKYATAGGDKRIRVYDDISNKVVETFKGSEDDELGHSNRVFSVKFSPDDQNILFSGGWDNTVFIWDMRKEHPIGHILGPNISGEALDVHGDYIVAGSYNSDHNLYLMNWKTQEIVKEVTWYDSEEYKDKNLTPPCVYSTQFSKPDAEFVIGGGVSRNEVRVFKNHGFEDLEGIASIASLKSGCLTVDCAHTDSSRFAIGCANGSVKLYRIEHDHEHGHGQ